MTKEKRLGRGLEALLGRLAAEEESQTAANSSNSLNSPMVMRNDEAPSVLSTVHSPLSTEGGSPTAPTRLAIDRIDTNPFQPRRDFDEAEIASMAESLEAFGLLQPIVVRQHGDRYQLVAGERRLRAARKAGWTEVPVHLIEADDRQMAEVAIVENLHRKDLNPLEKAASFQSYLEQYRCTQEELASRLKLDRSTIANLIRLLELPDAVQETLRQGKITQGHARALLPLGDEQSQIDFCSQIVREGMSVRQVEAAVQNMIHEADAADVGSQPFTLVGRDGVKSQPGRPQNEHLAALEQQFRAALGLKVSLKQTSRGRGRLVIQFRNHEEFEHLQSCLCETDSKPKIKAG